LSTFFNPRLPKLYRFLKSGLTQEFSIAHNTIPTSGSHTTDFGKFFILA
jgi:hypothetical protein